MRFATLSMIFLIAPVLAADDKPMVKQIPTKGMSLTFDTSAKVDAPTEIKTAEELAKSAVLKDAADEIKKHVDFDKEKLVVFMWQGSGGDRLAPELKGEGKTAVATFKLTPGLTFDLHQHTRLYTVPKDAAVKVVTAR